MTKIRTHAVATSAYERVSAHARAPNKKEYGALAHKLPGLILQNGLAQASGFLLAKSNSNEKDEHYALLNDLNEVLCASGTSVASNGAALHREIIRADLAGTMMLTRRALEASAWIKRYVQGVLRVDATGDQQPEGTTHD